MEKSHRAWSSHVDGATAIVMSRGPYQLDNPQSLALFRAVRTQMVIDQVYALTDFKLTTNRSRIVYNGKNAHQPAALRAGGWQTSTNRATQPIALLEHPFLYLASWSVGKSFLP